MSTKIPLYFLTRPSADGISVTRLFAWVSLKSNETDVGPMRAIIDSGSPISMIPFKFWGQAVVEMGAHNTIPTISDRPECDLGVTHGEVTISLLNDKWEKLVTDINLPADLCDTSEMPFLLGMHGFLKLGRLVMDYGSSVIWMVTYKIG